MTTLTKPPGAILTAVIALALMIATIGGTSAHEGHDHGATPAADSRSFGVAYLTIANDGDEADRLIGATTDMAEAVEIHQTTDESGVGVMMPVEGGVEIPAGGKTVLGPNGMHLMLVGLTGSLHPDTEYGLTLTFERAGEVTVTVPVRRNAPEGDEEGEPVREGDLSIQGAWSRPAPKIDGVATPQASPDAHEGH
jgi:periplasmic copper chaperone A